MERTYTVHVSGTVPVDAQAEDEPAIDLAGVVRTFGEVTALAGMDLRIGRGEVVGLLGHNGAGKTTTVRVIAGLLPVDHGFVRVVGRDPMTDGSVVRRTIGVLPARPVVDDRLTAHQNLRFAADVFGVLDDGLDARIRQTLETFELEDRADERVHGFSTGMRQRLSLARVLLPDPPILLLDEPTSALDPVAAHQVRTLLARLAREQNRTVVICTHDLSEAEQLCDRVIVLDRGQVLADGSPTTLAAQHGQATLRIDVAVTDRDRAAELVTRVTGVPTTVDDTGHFIARSVAREQMPGVLRALLNADIDVYEARRLSPSLEDVYLALYDRQGSSTPEEAGSRRVHP